MMKQTILLLIGAVAYVSAVCPGETPCSGHGTCGQNEICACDANWAGHDCSERKCAYKKAWADIKDTSVYSTREPHYYAECSNKGTCDTETGECECFEGFGGSGCERMACPEDCSGHGTCELMSSVNSGYTGWDATKVQVCECDPGYEGASCSSRICPKGNDPLTQFQSGSAEVDEVQTISLTSASSGTFTISYTSYTGEIYTTHAIDMATATVRTIKQALELLPNQVIPSVDVTLTGTAGGANLAFQITFSDPANSGDQPALSVSTTGCTAAGCQPYKAGLSPSVTASPIVTETTKGTKEFATCSNRGHCQVETGLCLCGEGYHGEACEQQTILV